jgi:uncharacterized protein (TIGR02594 family)
MTTLEIQTRLKELGFYHDTLDGVEGPNTRAAIIAFKTSVGLQARAYVGPITRRALKRAVVLPWMAEINKVLGLHETRDNQVLSRWLRSDGSTLGDPSQLPWCGDAVETAVKRGLPNEVLPAVLQENPYWARNWAEFGVLSGEVYGAVVSFKRGSGGHVAFLVGKNETGTLFRIRGGNQSNMVNDVWIDAERLMPSGTRWPSSYPLSRAKPIPVLSSDGAVISRNEA